MLRYVALCAALACAVSATEIEAQLWSGCTAPLGGVCFSVFTLEYAILAQNPVNVTVRTTASVKLSGPDLPMMGVNSWFLDLLFVRPRIDGISDFGQTPVGVSRTTGNITPSRFELTGVRDYRRSAFDLPLTNDGVELRSFNLGFLRDGETEYEFRQCRPQEFDGGTTCLPYRSVPEPGTYLLMLTGIMGLGFVAFRRRETLA